MFFRPELYRHPEFRSGALESLSAAPGLAAWGLMTGVAMVNSGLSTFEALLMGVIVFAGSSQLAAIPLIAAAAPMWVVLATGFCVNLRFVVFSAHMRPYMMHLPLWQRLLSGYLTTDLSYVLFTRRYPQHGGTPDQLLAQQAYLAGNSGVNWLAWVGCSVLGVLLARLIPMAWGFGFCRHPGLAGHFVFACLKPSALGQRRRVRRCSGGGFCAAFQTQHSAGDCGGGSHVSDA